MRATLLLPSLLLASVASAQTEVLDTSQETIESAYNDLRGNASLVFEMKGTEKDGTATTPVYAILYWKLSYDARTRANTRAQAELDVYVPTTTGSRLSLRIVGDGTNLYRYDIDRAQLSITTYGFYGTAMPAGYLDAYVARFSRAIRAATPGLSTHLVRLLDEMNPLGVAPQFTDWLPVNSAVSRIRRSFDLVPLPMRKLGDPIETSTVTDPITGRVYLRGDDQYVFYGMDTTASDRTVAFHLYDKNAAQEGVPPQWELQTVNVAQRSPGRVVDLTLTANAAAAPTWAFLPYSGAQAAGFRLVNGGGH